MLVCGKDLDRLVWVLRGAPRRQRPRAFFECRRLLRAWPISGFFGRKLLDRPADRLRSLPGPLWRDRGAFLVRLCFSKNGIMVCALKTRGAVSTKVRAGQRFILCNLFGDAPHRRQLANNRRRKRRRVAREVSSRNPNRRKRHLVQTVNSTSLATPCVYARRPTNNRIVCKKSGEGDGLMKLANTGIESGNVTLIL